MRRIDKTVFLSYRRTNFPWALAIFQDLSHNGFDVFIDYTRIASGRFEGVILENIRARAHFVVLLTPSALERCSTPGDLFRREIETALEHRRNIVPLMLENFDFGAPGIANQLTGELEAVKNVNGLRIVPEYFEEGMSRLRNKYLSVPLSAVLRPASPSAKRAAKHQQAAAASEPAVQRQELTATEWFERAKRASESNEKLRCYGAAISLKADYADAFCNRGVVRRSLGDLKGALQDYNEAIRLQPGDADILNNRGNALYDIGDLKGAQEDYDEAIRLRPDLAEAFNNRGDVRHDKGDLDGALQDYNVAIRLNPDLATAFYNRSNVRRAKGDKFGAADDLQSYLNLGGGASDQKEIEQRISSLKLDLAANSATAT